MKNIFIVLRDGEVLMPEVIKGIAKQTEECCIIPITSEGKAGISSEIHARKNRRNNLLRAVRLAKDYFLLMDSDVVLGDENIIKEMFDNEKNSNRKIVACTTKHEMITFCKYIPHSLILIKGQEIENFKKFLENVKDYKDCYVCEYCRANENKIISLENPKIEEIRRIDLNERK